MPHIKVADVAGGMLKKAGIRHTMPRMAVLSALLEAHRPLSIDQLADDLADLKADKATIYRTLMVFVEKGIAHQVDIGDRVFRFAACGDEHHRQSHAHFVCRKCGELECIDDEIGSFPLHPAPKGHIVEEQEILLRGLCPDCKRS
jgi:Fur family ferric uptake transcriptional regulator